MILTKCDIKEINLDALIDSKINSSGLNELLLIVPTNRKVRYLKRDLISSSPHKVVSGINIETLGTYSSKLLTGSAWQNVVVSEEAAIVLLKQCFRETGLKYFSNYKGEIPFGTLERIKNVISEYKRHGISPEKLYREAENLSTAEKLKAEDISNIYRKYEEKFSLLGVKEIGDVYKSLNQLDENTFEKKFRDLFPDVKTIIINGFDEFTLPEIEIINSSAEINNVDLYFNFDYYNFNPAIFSHLDKCYRKLKEKGFGSIKDNSVIDKKPFVEDVKQNMFLKTTSIRQSVYKQKIVQITAYNREQEIALIAKEIKIIIEQNKVEPNNICVAFNLIKPYSQIIRDQFGVYGIPFNLTDRLSINTSPPVIAIINLLEIIANDFYYKNIFRSLSNSLIKIDNVDLNNLLKVSVELKIISGFKTWTDRLNDAIAEQQIDDESNNEMKRYHVNYEKALYDIKSIYSLLRSFDKAMTADEFYKNLHDLIAGLKIHLKILQANDDSVEKDIKALTTFLNSVNELIHLFKLEFGKTKKQPLKFYLSQLITIASFSRYNIKEKHGYGVQVTTLNEIRGLNFDYLFIAGLTDGDFPTRFSPEIFLSGSFARQELQHQVEERYLFYQALCSWQKILYFTNPLTDERKELVESGFLQEFKKKFEITERNESTYKDIISSKIELQKYIGKNLGIEESGLTLPQDISIDIKNVKDSIEISRLRSDAPHTDSIYNGVLTNELTPELHERLEDFRNNQYSVTQLESYAKCPYQYFAERVLHLNTIEEPAEELEAFELGSLIHSILFEFYTEIKKTGITVQAANDKDFNKAERLLFETAEKKISTLKLSSSLSFFEKEKLLGIEGNKRNSLLYLFLKQERESTGGFIPKYFEMIFGEKDNNTGDESSADNDFKIGDINIRGKIDRVDINEEEGLLKVIDYKLSGKKPTKDDIFSGISLQLPLYLYVAKELIKAQLHNNLETYGAEIYSLKLSEKEFGPKIIRIDNSRSKGKNVMIPMAEEMIKICLDSIKLFITNISAGKFNLSKLEDRENKVCRYCNFRSICRIQEVN
jgi:ATP-dependent helicase/nuclease subunit B